MTTTTTALTNVLPFAHPTSNDNARQHDGDLRPTDAIVADIRASLATLARRGVRLPTGTPETFLDELEQAVIEADARSNPRGFRRRAARLGIAA